MALIKVTCTRCGGSGKFSFNLVRGTVCFLCDGVGHKMVDEATERRRLAAKAKRDAVAAATQARRMELVAQVCAELDAQLGPFPDTDRGAWERVQACQRAHGGKTPGDLVQARMRAQ